MDEDLAYCRQCYSLGKGLKLSNSGHCGYRRKICWMDKWMVFSKQSLLLPEIPRVTFHTNCNSLGQFLSQIAGFGRVRSEKSPLALKGPCIICKAKLPRPGFLPLAPPHFLIIPGPLPGAFDFVFHLSGLCWAERSVPCSSEDRENVYQPRTKAMVYLWGPLVFPWVLFTEGEISYWN